MRTSPILLAVVILPFFTGCTSVKQDFQRNLIKLDRRIQDVNQYLRPQPSSAAVSGSRNVNWAEVSTDNLPKLTEAQMQAEWLGSLVPDSEFRSKISAAGATEEARSNEIISGLMASSPEIYGGSFNSTSFGGGESYSGGNFTSDTSIPMYTGPSDSGYSAPSYDNYSTPSYDTYSTPSYEIDSTPSYETYSTPSYDTYSAQPVFAEPAPVYSAPTPVYSAPAPVYSAPPQVYSAPEPVYSAPAPMPTYSVPATTFAPPAISQPSIQPTPAMVPSYQSQPSYRLERRPAQESGTLYRNQFGTEIYQ